MQLKRALQSRPVIDQARGTLMAISSCTADQAFEVLVDASQNTNLKVHGIARDLVASTNGAPLEDPVATALRLALTRIRARR
ncbi:ANTAR domain-containing protein [Streptomyces sp. 8N706]|uniref:ANTAR domain-containing protein n=1 Tax=Streptomyces sp. 8N706 TaxID=3457416 RepID=UPI003FD40321